MHVCNYKGETWVRVCCTDQVDRWIRMFSTKSLGQLLKIYGFMDSSGCVNKADFRITRGSRTPIRMDTTLDGLTETQRSTKGVPQRVFNSGLCWYNAMCFVMLFCRQMRALLFAKDSKLASISEGALNSKEKAEQLRHYLYHKYALGDRPGQRPEDDGQNGCSQFCILLANLDIPVVRFFAENMHELTDDVIDQSKRHLRMRSIPSPGEAGLLIVRCFRTRWTPRRRIVFKNRRYKLIGMFIGSEHCGHQIGVSTCDMRVCRWAMSDSDAAQHGIGPMFWSIQQRAGETRSAFRLRWRKMWDDVIPVTLFGNKQVCDFNPINRPTHELERFSRSLSTKGRPGVVNTDFVYISDGLA